jgi:hypothetical protein
MNVEVEIGTETLIFLFWEYLFRNFGILSLQCGRVGLGGFGNGRLVVFWLEKNAG